jgi:hypothetical protein
MSNVQPPARGLGSNSNYLLNSNGNPLLDLKIAIDVTKDIISNIGFAFQLNAYSPAGDYSAWQQYFFEFGVPSGHLAAGIEPWPNKGKNLINQRYQLLTVPDLIIRAGYKLTILLGNDPLGNVRYVTFTVVDNHGNQTGTTPSKIDLLTLSLYGKSTLATTADLSPIVAFELNLVGPIDALQSYLTSGAGTITYTASNALTALSKLPSGTDASDTITAETTNSAYGELPEGASTSIVQSFTAIDPGAYAPGGPFAVSQQFGANQTDFFAIDRAGQFVVFYVEGSGHWSATTGLGPTGFAKRGAVLAATQQFGAANQTNVFLVDQRGQLSVFWTEHGGGWNGPVPIGPTGNAGSGAHLAVSQQFGAANQTDVFLIDKNDQLNVFWVQGAGVWNGPVLVGPAGLAKSGAAIAASQQFGAPNQTDVFVVDKNGQLNVFWVQGAGAWSNPVKIGPTGNAPSGAALAVSQQFGTTDQTDVFLVDKNGQLNVFWVQGTGAWNGPVKIGPAGLANPGAAIAVSQQFGANNQTDVFVVDKNGQLNVFWVQGTGAWNGPQKIGPAGIAASGAFVGATRQFGANQTDVFVINQTGINGPGWPTVFWVDGAGQWNGPLALVTQG